MDEYRHINLFGGTENNLIHSLFLHRLPVNIQNIGFRHLGRCDLHIILDNGFPDKQVQFRFFYAVIGQFRGDADAIEECFNSPFLLEQVLNEGHLVFDKGLLLHKPHEFRE